MCPARSVIETPNLLVPALRCCSFAHCKHMSWLCPSALGAAAFHFLGCCIACLDKRQQALDTRLSRGSSVRICWGAGMGVARWTKALADLQGLGCSLSRANMEALFRSAVHVPVCDILPAHTRPCNTPFKSCLYACFSALLKSWPYI